MGSRVTALVWVWAALSVVGCGKSDGGSDPIPQADLPKRVADLVCDSTAGCCRSGGFPIDVAACKAGYTAELQAGLADNLERGVRYDATAAGDCLAAAASNIVCGEVNEAATPACKRIFVGTAAPGQPCTSSRECAPVAGRTVRCGSDDGLSPEVCTANSNDTTPHGKSGEACTSTCSDDNSCDFASTPVPLPGPGGVPEPQPAPVACYLTDGLFCNSGHCAPLLAVGEACLDYEACRGTAFCNFNTGLCTAPQPNGSPCDSSRDCQSNNCANDGPVADPASGANGVCVSATAVTAAQCTRASTRNQPDSTEPGSGATDSGTAGTGP
jgi:hypothetical protein